MPHNCYYYASSADRQYYPPDSDIIEQLARLVREIESHHYSSNIHYSKRCV